VAEILPDYPSNQGDTLQDVGAELAKTALIRLRPDVLVDNQTQKS
jgi:hypothetical protein